MSKSLKKYIKKAQSIERKKQGKNSYLRQKNARSAKNGFFFKEHNSDDDTYDGEKSDICDKKSSLLTYHQERKLTLQSYSHYFGESIGCKCGGRDDIHYCMTCGKLQRDKSHFCVKCYDNAELIKEQKIKKQQKPTLVEQNPFYLLTE